jgi:beta-lactamase regulating signal transducer with metallopeptidase domain
MTWQLVALRWLGQAALGGIIVLAMGCLATSLCRQPVQKARLAIMTLVCALIVPWIGALPIAPRWSAPILPVDVGVPTHAHGGISTPSQSVVAKIASQRTAISKTSVSRVIEPTSVTRSMPVLRHPIAVAEPRVSDSMRKLISTQLLISAILSLYVAATAGLMAWWLLGQAVLFRTCRQARPVSDEIRSRFLTLSGPRGARVRLLESDRIALPFTFTWFRAVILLPSSLCREADSVALRYCLAHEWSHVERRDSWAWTLASASGFALFYQPLFWWLRRQLRLCQDFLADDRAAESGSPEEYAAYLVAVARFRLVGSCLPALGIGDRRSNLHRRIVMLVEDRLPLQRRCRRIWSAAAALLASAIVLAASGLRLDAAPPQDKPKTEERAAAKPAAKVETLSYTGVVKDKDTGGPIEGASVTVRRSILKPGGDNRVLQETKHKTDADGKYSFLIPPEQVAERSLYIELDVEHSDYATQAGFGYSLGMIRKNETIGGRPFFESVELRPGQPVTGRVQAPDGNLAKGVEILAYSVTTKKGENTFEYGSFSKAKTNDRGEFRVVLTTPGQAVFWILPSDAAPEAHRIPDEKRGDLGLFVLNKGSALKGRVLDSQGKPIAGIYVNAEHERDSGDATLEGLNVADAINRSAVTDADGGFALAPLPVGNFRIQPGIHARDGSGGREKRPLADVFVTQKFTIKDGETPEALELRAAPHVVIEAQWLDGKGQPTWGFEHHIFGQIDGTFWFGEAKPDDKGKVIARVPHGLENVQFGLMTNEHGALKYRLGKDARLQSGRQIHLGTLDHDVKGIEIVHYKAPILLVKAQTKDGSPVPGLIVSADYTETGDDQNGKMILRNGVQSDVSFEAQEDGRHRSSQLSPDREVTVKAQAEGFQPATTNVKLPEGDTKEVVLTLEPK